MRLPWALALALLALPTPEARKSAKKKAAKRGGKESLQAEHARLTEERARLRRLLEGTEQCEGAAEGGSEGSSARAQLEEKGFAIVRGLLPEDVVLGTHFPSRPRPTPPTG